MTMAVRRGLPSVLLVLSLALPAAGQPPPRDWRQLVSTLPPGTRMELDLLDGTHVEGTLIAHEADAFLFNPKTRIPVTPWRIALSEIRALDVKASGGGMRPGTKVLIGIGVGLGVIALIGALVVAAGY
jgi:hypothetical protein